jgi:hypothetical protein
VAADRQIAIPPPAAEDSSSNRQVSGNYDYAIYEHIWPLRIVRDAVLLVLASCVIWLATVAIKQA